MSVDDQKRDLKEPTPENIQQWFNEKIQKKCVYCDNENFFIGNQFALVHAVSFDSSDNIDLDTLRQSTKYIVVTCKKCGITRFFNTAIAGFNRLLKD